MEHQQDDKIQDFINAHVIDDEWVVVGVPGVDPPAKPYSLSVPGIGSPSYSYTVGLTYLGLPEMVIVGMDAGAARAVLEGVVLQALGAGEFQHGGLVTGYPLPHRPDRPYPAHPMMVLKVHPDKKRQIANQVFKQFGHWDFELQQLVLPDDESCFPWDANYITRRIDMAGVLGRVPRASQ